MLREIHYHTLEEFEQWINLPENADKTFEFIGGEIVEVPSNPRSSQVGSTISGELYIYLKQNPIANLTGEAGGFIVGGERYAPDVAVTLKNRQLELAEESYNPIAPDLAVEVDFPTSYQSQEQLRIKVVNYLAAGTTVWLVRPEFQRIEVYVPMEAVRILGMDDTLTCPHILPNFELPVKTVFQK